MAEVGAPDRRVLWGLIAVTVLLVAGGTVLRRTAPEPDRVAAAGEGAAAVEVRVVRVVADAARRRAVLTGVIEPRRSVRLASETMGRVLEVGAEALDTVEADQVLVRVDPLPAEIAVRRAEASLARARSQLGLAQTSLERQELLAERAVASDQALDDARNRARVAAATIRESKAVLEQARDDLAKKTIRAPFAGVLRSFEVEPGEFLAGGQSLGELLDLTTARIQVGLSDRQIVTVRAGEPVELEVEAWPNERFAGTVLRVGAAADVKTKKFPVEIEVDNEPRRLLPGMIGRVALDLDATGPRLIVPREAVGEEYGQRFVFAVETVGGKAHAHRRQVQVREVPFDLSVLEVVTGLVEGDEIAVGGAGLLRDGSPVRAGRMVVSPSAGGEADRS